MTPLRSTIMESLTAVGVDLEPNHGDDTPLPLDSMAVLELHNQLEIRFDLRLPAREVLPENFETVRALMAWIGSKLESHR